jgi:chemotaxis response regulator CheB
MADDKLCVLIVEDSHLTARVMRDMIEFQPDMTAVDVAAPGRRACAARPSYAPTSC